MGLGRVVRRESGDRSLALKVSKALSNGLAGLPDRVKRLDSETVRGIGFAARLAQSRAAKKREVA